MAGVLIMNPNMYPIGTEVVFQKHIGRILEAQDDGWRYVVQCGDYIVSNVAGHELTVLPVIGMGATLRYYSDRKACTIIAVSPTGKKVTVREDKSIRTDDNGMSDQQTYRFEPDPKGELHTFYRQGNGSYAISGVALDIGYRSTYHDYSF